MRETNHKPQRLINVASGHEVYDNLHTRSNTEGLCTRYQCNGALMLPRKSGTEPRSTEEALKLAREFIDEYYHSIKRYNSEQHRLRWEHVCREMNERGTYDLTQTELVYGAKLAWRNAPRCIGRIQWSKLQVFDARYVTTASGMFEALCNHIKYGTNKGNLRSAITIFPQRTDGKHDFRVWNSQLISYAGYKQEDGTVVGDPANVEFTEVCQRLGWRGKGGRWDVLPLVLSANGHDPEWFDIPPDLILTVPITHPEYKWFEELELQWYGLPAVVSLLFDCGGLEFPAAPFNGWYMVSEIGTRDLCDSHRYNIMETVGKRMGLDTRSPTNLWKDKVLVEVNVAVLHSFQSLNVTIVDHHSAAESFMKHFENEQKLRGGCPADWVWIVPPLSGSITPVFHQEMTVYYLKPSYEYQDPAWKTHVWKKNKDVNRNSIRRTKRKFRFKEIARAVKFTSKLFGKALSKRIKATILYATETGKSEMYAKKLGEIFGHTFNAQVCCMADYDLINIEHETLVLVVTSTFGNGDPPENGEEFIRKLVYKYKPKKDFAKNLYAMKVSGTAADIDDITSSMHRSLSFMRMNSLTEGAGVSSVAQENGVANTNFRSSITSDIMSENNFGALSNVRFAVFALGSSAYPNFCAFGKYVDNLLAELGGERLMKLTCGDELAGQEQAFKQWAAEVFNVGCETFCLDDDVAMKEATAALKTEAAATADKIKLYPCNLNDNVALGLSRAHGKRVRSCEVLASRNLHGENTSSGSGSRGTQQVILSTSSTNELHYQPGDHVAILPANRKELVEAVLSRLQQCPDPDQPIQVLLLKELHSINGITQTWEPHERLPSASVRELLTRYLDITTPPTSNFLHVLAEYAHDNDERTRLDQLATDPHEYEEWKHFRYPHLSEVLEELPSVNLDAGLLLTHLPLLGPRFYSISSSPDAHPGEVHVTVTIVQYHTEGGKGPLHYGVCSNFLKEVSPGDHVELFVRSAPSFHLPRDPTVPIIMVGPGTGVAPFRGFWHHRHHAILHKKIPEKVSQMTLFFGCRTREMDLYSEEKEMMKACGVLTHTHLALSREPTLPKTYVQDLLVEVGGEVYRRVVLEKGHFYVCGDCTMAEYVYQKLKAIVQEHGRSSDQEVENFMLRMRDENRYHEDIFGITLRTEEIHRQKRESARVRMSSVAQQGPPTPTQAPASAPSLPTPPPRPNTQPTLPTQPTSQEDHAASLPNE
uniref:Nitric oxide synthase n=1 Tax=Scylla paramamosain TaxID=85552 RepID=G0M6G3_SCYPA|nr:nitric oxide synthase [Scylla paramamosain]